MSILLSRYRVAVREQTSGTGKPHEARCGLLTQWCCWVQGQWRAEAEDNGTGSGVGSVRSRCSVVRDVVVRFGAPRGRRWHAARRRARIVSLREDRSLYRAPRRPEPFVLQTRELVAVAQSWTAGTGIRHSISVTHSGVVFEPEASARLALHAVVNVRDEIVSLTRSG